MPYVAVSQWQTRGLLLAVPQNHPARLTCLFANGTGGVIDKVGKRRRRKRGEKSITNGKKRKNKDKKKRAKTIIVYQC